VGAAARSVLESDWRPGRKASRHEAFSDVPYMSAPAVINRGAMGSLW